MSGARSALYLVAPLCTLAACALRTAPDDGSRMDAAAEHVYHCVEPGPQPSPGNCSEAYDWGDCRRWARQYAAGATAYAGCVAPYQTPSREAGCVQATSCEELGDGGYECHCGNEPACGPGQVCVGDTPDATPYCRCTMQ